MRASTYLKFGFWLPVKYLHVMDSRLNTCMYHSSERCFIFVMLCFLFFNWKKLLKTETLPNACASRNFDSQEVSVIGSFAFTTPRLPKQLIHNRSIRHFVCRWKARIQKRLNKKTENLKLNTERTHDLTK